jgi:soluble lytic murein transglycosylase-like protein
MKLKAIAAAALLSVSSLNVTHNDSIPIASSGRAHAEETIQHMVSRMAEDHDVPVKFAHAIVKVESDYDPKIRGAAGEYGLGQIFCSTARDVGFNGKCSELLNPETNLEYTMRYLKQGLKLADGNLCAASTFYNTGRVGKTSSYCRKIMSKIDT